MFARLQELQNARREFLLGMLKFSNNFIKLPDEDMSALKAGLPPCSPKIYHIPDVENDPAFQVNRTNSHHSKIEYSNLDGFLIQRKGFNRIIYQIITSKRGL